MINTPLLNKISMLHNLNCCETRFRLLCHWYLLHSSFNVAFRQSKLNNIFIFGMANYPIIIAWSCKTISSHTCIQKRWRIERRKRVTDQSVYSLRLWRYQNKWYFSRWILISCRSGYCYLNKGECNLNQSKDDFLVGQVANNTSWNNSDRHKIHGIFPINCFVFIITLVWKTVHNSAMTQIKAHLMEKPSKLTTPRWQSYHQVQTHFPFIFFELYKVIWLHIKTYYSCAWLKIFYQLLNFINTGLN